MAEIDRSKYIGGSDAGALMGGNEYKTVRDVWDKLRGNTDTDLSGNPHIKRGNALEPHVEDWIYENLDPTINNEKIYEMFDAGDASDQIFLQDREHNFIGGHPDGIGWGDPSTTDLVVYEIKVPASRSLDRLKRYGIHARYYWQVMHYLMIVNRTEYTARRGVVVLWDTDRWGEPLFVNIWYDEEKAAELLERCRDVYFASQAGFLPEFEDIPADEMALYDGQVDMEGMLSEYHSVKAKEKELKERRKRLKAKVLSQLEDKEEGETVIQTPGYRANVKYNWGRYDSTRLAVSER